MYIVLNYSCRAVEYFPVFGLLSCPFIFICIFFKYINIIVYYTCTYNLQVGGFYILKCKNTCVCACSGCNTIMTQQDYAQGTEVRKCKQLCCGQRITVAESGRGRGLKTIQPAINLHNEQFGLSYKLYSSERFHGLPLTLRNSYKTKQSINNYENR